MLWILGIAALVAGGLVLALRAARNALFNHAALDVTELELPVEELPPALEGYTIAVLSDLHQLPHPAFDRMLRRACDVVREARPHLIALLGDYGASFKHARALNATLYQGARTVAGTHLRRLEAPDGLVAVLGNHDYYADARATAAWLRSLGVTVLVGETLVIRRGDAELQVHGMDDALEGTPAAPDSSGSAVPRIVLSHVPDGVQLLGGARADLVLSGHTHGGQIVLPWYGAPLRLSRVCSRRTASGWVPNAHAPLYVTRGVGAQIPLRLRCPPEVVIVRLRRRASPDQQPA